MVLVMGLAEELESKRQVILDAMFEHRNRELATPDDGIRQFLLGYFNVLVAAASGDDSIRQEYLQAVVPGLRTAGMPLAMVMDGMVRVAMDVAAAVDAEHLAWLIDFNADYTYRLTDLWGAA